LCGAERRKFPIFDPDSSFSRQYQGAEIIPIFPFAKRMLNCHYSVPIQPKNALLTGHFQQYSIVAMVLSPCCAKITEIEQ